ncbi:hypothetical protein [Paenibacillus aquistagni]|uniref:hypothetical protein n=1 Tax=Paenibacillus aquistagni TaxID=1852522 RepID=UPI001131BECB|nr:hypothetical protein [Paenibacillus aquistagni]NMM55095.1 hypothetical protein [Paenibacillus aquistagni]
MLASIPATTMTLIAGWTVAGRQIQITKSACFTYNFLLEENGLVNELRWLRLRTCSYGSNKGITAKALTILYCVPCRLYKNDVGIHH